MAIAALQSASDRHFARSRQSSSAMPRSWYQDALPKVRLDLSDLSVEQKQDHSFATHTKQRTFVNLFGLHATCILVSQSDKNYTTSANENGQNWNIHKKPLHFSTHCRTIFSLLRGSSLSPTGSGPVLVSNVPHEETQALVHHCLVLDLDNQKDCHCFCTIRLVKTCHSRNCSLLSSTRSCWLHSCITLSDVLDDFLLRLVGVSLWPSPGCADSRCSPLLPATPHPLQYRVW